MCENENGLGDVAQVLTTHAAFWTTPEAET